jgi:hypothetical protein
MKINKTEVSKSITALTKSTTNKFWGTLAIIKSINEPIQPNKTYEVESSSIMSFLDDLFDLDSNNYSQYQENIIYVKFSTSWKERLRTLTLKNNLPRLTDAAIFYNKYKEFSNPLNSSQIKDNFLNDCKIRVNDLTFLFIDNTNENIELESYDKSFLIKILEGEFGTIRKTDTHLSLEPPFFIQSKPSELKRAPFFQTLYSGDRIKELLLVSDSNLEDLYPIEKTLVKKIDTGNNLIDFIQASEKCGLYFPRNLILRLIASLLSKPFLILTGLSGSGKTKLAQAFTQWICNVKSKSKFSNIFIIGEELNSQRVIYKVTKSDLNSVTFEQVDTQIKVTLPYELIYEWIDIIKNNNLDISTPTRSIRELVSQVTKYSSQLNSFESHLKAAAFELISRSNNNIQDISQYRVVPVGADWTNREPLLGYPNALDLNKYVMPDSSVLDLIIQAISQPDLPHFLILDEMNLSHVERYFADFLSVMESNEEIPLHSCEIENGVPQKLKVPSNLFIIGTVNIDETTNMFSPKVLDRANTIEFRVTKNEMEKFLGNIKEINMDALTGKGASMAKSFLDMARSKEFATEDIEAINNALVQFFGELKKTGAEFGYRTATEILRLIRQLTVLDSDLTTNQKIDIAIMQKLLPKLHGSRRKLCPVLETLGSFCATENLNVLKDVFGKDDFDFENHPNVQYRLSLEKIARMHKGAIDNGFASFAEA